MAEKMVSALRRRTAEMGDELAPLMKPPKAPGPDLKD